VCAAQECGIHTQQQCYPLAFGVPAALMVISLGKTECQLNTHWDLCVWRVCVSDVCCVLQWCSSLAVACTSKQIQRETLSGPCVNA